MSAMRSLEILMTADAVGGVWQYATDLSAELGQMGHRVTLALLGPPPTQAQREAAAIAGLGLIETGLPLDWLSPGPEPIQAAAEEIARLARDAAADVVHCNMPSLVGAARFASPVIAVTHGCLATWWQAARSDALPPEFGWHREMTRAGLIAADAIVAPSAGYARIVEQMYHLPAPPMVVHNGRRPLVEPDPGSRKIRAALTAGRLWDRAKNATLLDEAAGLIDVPFLAAGPMRGPHGEEYSPKHLRALGRLEARELATLLRLRPVFVSAATFEPFGLAVLEAAAAGCPLVLSDIATFRELWDGAALFVDPADATGFARAITALTRDEDRARELGGAAAARAARYTPEATARRMEQLYSRLVAPVEVAA